MEELLKNKFIVAMGFFDGVHRGHKAVLDRASALAREHGCKCAAMTFDVPPAGKTQPMITQLEERTRLMINADSLDGVIVLHFDDDLRKLNWETFIDKMEREYKACGFVTGDDFRFGYLGEGNAEKLRAKCAEKGLYCATVDGVLENGERISSTAIKKLIAEGKVEEATLLLGHGYALTGKVVSGFQVGRTLGFPTANLKLDSGIMCPHLGVYASRFYIGGRSYNAVTSIGVRPTFGGTDIVSVESHLLDYSGDLYGKSVRVELCSFLRDEMKLPSADALKEQIRKDIRNARAILEQ